MFGAVDRALGLRVERIGERADAVEHGEEAADLFVDQLLVDVAGPHGGGQCGPEEAGRAGHLDVEAGARRSDR